MAQALKDFDQIRFVKKAIDVKKYTAMFNAYSLKSSAYTVVRVADRKKLAEVNEQRLTRITEYATEAGVIEKSLFESRSRAAAKISNAW